MKRLIILCIASAFILTSVAGCLIQHDKRTGRIVVREGGHKKKGPPGHAHHKRYKYRYYPNCEIYYDLGRKIYFHYRLGHWRMSVELPSYECIKINDYRDYVELYMDSSRPEKYHYKTRDKYPGKHHKRYEKYKRHDKRYNKKKK